MNKIENVRDLGHFVFVIGKIKKIEKQLHHLAEADCNYGLSDRQQTRENNLVKQAQDLAKELGMMIYHQGDPRGCQLYLGEDLNSSNYNNGIAMCD